MRTIAPSLLALASFVVGCETTSSTSTQGPAVEVREVELESPFPDAASLMDLAARPRPEAAALFGPAVADVDTWTFVGVGGTTVEAAPYAGEDRNAVVAAQAIADDATGRRLTQGMQCLAEEYGQFVLAHGAAPAADIEAFMAMRCGTPVAHPRIVATPVPLASAKPLHADRDRARLQAAFAGTAPGAQLGFYKGRGKTSAIEVLASGVPEATLDAPLALAGHAGQVELRGTVAWDLDTVVGWATAGAQGVAACTRTGPVASPAFALRCPVAAEGTTTIELHAAPRGELPERLVLRVLVAGGATVPTTYRAETLPLPADATRDEASVVNAVNALRLAAQLPPVAGVEAQSKVLGALLPQHAAAASDPAQAELANQAELGMIAGREIEGDLLSGGVLVTAAPVARSFERELAGALASPHARALVLDPQAKHLAFTTTEDQGLGMRRSALAVYAEPAAEADHSADVAAYLDALDLQRQAAGLPPVVRGQDPADLQTMQATAARVYAGEIGPATALDELLRYIATKTKRSFKGSIVFPYSLAGWSPTFQGSLVEAEEVTVLAAIGRHRVQDGWGRPMVVVLYEAKTTPPAAAPAADPAVAAEPSPAEAAPPAEGSAPAAAEPVAPAPAATPTP
ncbi:MAG: hypothetical protein KC501_26420 [Myxococcales bacterium]|nr:hypothetical protein [Myxococcales bacterium]